MRLFVALVPPEEAMEHLAEHLEPRVAAGPDLRWTDPHQWHVTLAFLGEVAEWRLDDLESGLGAVASRYAAPTLSVAGAGAFPNPYAARVLWAGVEPVTSTAPTAPEAPEAPAAPAAPGRSGMSDEWRDRFERFDRAERAERGEPNEPGRPADLAELAAVVRGAANAVGATPDGTRFHPHVTLARFDQPTEATRWVRAIDPYRGPAWTATDLEVVASHLGEGRGRRPRYERVARLPVGRPPRG
jgi:2'-5' RNA ligase